MKLNERIYLVLSRLMPSFYKRKVEKLVPLSGEAMSAEYWLGSSTLLALLIGIAITLVPFALEGKLGFVYAIIGAAAFLLIEIITYVILLLKVEDRKTRIENALPDVLIMVSANLKAGMDPFQALKTAGQRELGPLKEEIESATAKSMGTTSFSEALLSISKNVNSDILERSMKLIAAAIKSGGHMAKLLEDLAKDISEVKKLKKEIDTNTKTYTLFIFFIIIFAAPLLMAISIQFLNIIVSIQGKANLSQAASTGVGFLIGEITITESFMTNASLVMLVVSSILSSMLIGVISAGKEEVGLRYSPIIMLLSIIVFYIARLLVSQMISAA